MFTGLSLAKNGTNRDLREHLGLKVPQNDPECSIDCPNCGSQVIGAKWVKKTEDKNE